MKCLIFDLLQDSDPVAFGDDDKLPKWLVGSGFDPWERGNRWMLAMAETAGAERVTLLALWDGKAEGFALGGTAHMVQIAREAGTIDIDRIDATQLVSRLRARARGRLEEVPPAEPTG